VCACTLRGASCDQRKSASIRVIEAYFMDAHTSQQVLAAAVCALKPQGPGSAPMMLPHALKLRALLEARGFQNVDLSGF